MRPDDPRHGTMAGYSAHHRANQTACDACRRAKNADWAKRRQNIDDEPDELTGGEWRPVGGILRWFPVEERPEPVDVKAGGLIACPTCHARVDQLCRTSTGRHREPHANRIVARRCGCGADLESGKKVCDLCRAEARRANARVGMRNTRARRRLGNEVAA